MVLTLSPLTPLLLIIHLICLKSPLLIHSLTPPLTLSLALLGHYSSFDNDKLTRRILKGKSIYQ